MANDVNVMEDPNPPFSLSCASTSHSIAAFSLKVEYSAVLLRQPVTSSSHDFSNSDCTKKFHKFFFAFFLQSRSLKSRKKMPT